MSLTRQLKDMKRGLLVSPLHEAYLSRPFAGNVLLDDKIAEFVKQQLMQPQRDRRLTWSASGLGSCERMRVLSWVGTAPAKDRFTSDTNNYFIHGTWTHLKWQSMGFDAGWLAEAEVSCSIPLMELTGTIDGILTTGEGWELKSINSRGFRMIASDGPLEKHLLQIHAYMIATGIRTWSLVYEDKDTQQWREYVIPYDEGMGQEVMNELARLNAALATKTLPPVLPACQRKEGSAFKQCPHKDVCLDIKRWPAPARLRIARG
jgi:hypothetical protein